MTFQRQYIKYNVLSAHKLKSNLNIIVLDKLYLLLFEKMFEHSTAPQTLKKQTKVEVEDKTAKTNTSSGSLMTSLERLKAVALWQVFPELLADTHLRD